MKFKDRPGGSCHDQLDYEYTVTFGACRPSHKHRPDGLRSIDFP